MNLVESKDYGFCCLVKTSKQVLDRLEGIENRTITKITPRERINRSLWNRVALREAVINNIIHNDYTTELVPKFEIFADRLEMTSAGYIHPGEEREDFFAGYSIPRNKTLMRVFKDLDMVEYLGSGMPRILKAYPRDAYIFSSRFIRTVFPKDQEALMMEKEEMAEGGAIELTNRQREILGLIKSDSKISYRAIASTLGINESAVQKQLATLNKKGVLKRMGGTRGRWVVLK